MIVSSGQIRQFTSYFGSRLAAAGESFCFEPLNSSTTSRLRLSDRDSIGEGIDEVNQEALESDTNCNLVTDQNLAGF